MRHAPPDPSWPRTLAFAVFMLLIILVIGLATAPLVDF